MDSFGCHIHLAITVNSNFPPPFGTSNSKPLVWGDSYLRSKLSGGGLPDATAWGVIGRVGSVTPILYLPCMAPDRPLVWMTIVPELSAVPMAAMPEASGTR